MEDDGIELIEDKTIVTHCWYYRGDLSTLVYFHRNCLGIGVISIPLEYILSITVRNHIVMLSTCVDIVGDTVVKVDRITIINLAFAKTMDVESFRKKLYDGMLYCKDHGEYDRSVFKLNIIKRFFRKHH
jgi:hypothetical protein